MFIFEQSLSSGRGERASTFPWEQETGKEGSGNKKGNPISISTSIAVILAGEPAHWEKECVLLIFVSPVPSTVLGLKKILNPCVLKEGETETNIYLGLTSVLEPIKQN